MAAFDWDAWIDSERQAAEERTGASGSDVITSDARYARALDVWVRRNRAVLALQQAEREARSMAASTT